MKVHLAKIISEGYAYGEVFRLLPNVCYNCHNVDIDKEVLKLEKGIEEAVKDIIEHSKYEYFDIQKMIISDPVLLKESINAIKTLKISAESAISMALDKYKESLMNSKSTYLQERIYDLEDVKRKILLILSGKKNNYPKKPFVLVTDELMPSTLLENQERLLGIVTLKAGYLSHGAILARSYGIPFVVSDNIDFKDGENILIDTRRKIVCEDATSDLINDVLVCKANRDNFKVVENKDYNILANVFGNEEIKKAMKLGFAGVGLYRTEFVFMHQDKALNYEEQLKIYSEAVDLVKDKSICFRTFDIGDDKQISYIKTHHKGFLNYVNNPLIFEDQVKAIINSNKYGNVKIMFPMVENKEEFVFLKNWVLKLKEELKNEQKLEIGMMLETKNALNHISDFVEADFISVGTNDLTTELYQIRRDDIENGIDIYVKDLMDKLTNVVKFCNDSNIYLSVCGELASISKTNMLLMEIGIKNFSISTSAFGNLNKNLADFLAK